MPSPMSALNVALKSPSPPAASGSSASTGEDSAKKPAFDDMVRRPVKRDDAPRAPHARASDTKEPVRQRPDKATSKQDEAAAASVEDEKPEDAVVASALPPVLLELPSAVAILPADAPANVLVDPPGAPVPGGALPAANAIVADALLAGARATIQTALPGAPITNMTTDASGDAGPAIASGNAATPLPAATSTPATAIDAKAPLQNLLSFATHLASGHVAAAVPEAITLGRDLVDAFRNEDGDAPAPTGHLLAGVGASNQVLGLSRTDTVNATQAPSADLHGGHFDDDIGDAVRWMADQKIGHAHIKITPNDLGTVEIRLRLDGDRVHADFSSAQADVRQALESSLPRLREMLGQHGFQLAHADVGQQHAPPSRGGGSSADGDTGDAAEPATEAPRTVRMTARGLVDAYA